MAISTETMKQVLMHSTAMTGCYYGFLSDDCSFDFPRGSKPWGQRFIGKEQVREALAGRFSVS